MKRLFPFILLLLLALPTLAAALEPAPDQPSAEELRARIFAPKEPAEPPERTPFKGTCTVSNDCGPFSATISCSSSSGNCSSGFDFVVCNGVRKNCAPCKVSTNCSNGQIFSCTGTNTTDCELEPHCFVVCSGVFHGSCSVCP
ncbi:MAG TPA: hypothetical protein VGX68_06980 [Thermoanaerobaculia bacterium]|nr:hypothetical protein [Thermoanaerobaculia bacterium]